MHKGPRTKNGSRRFERSTAKRKQRGERESNDLAGRTGPESAGVRAAQ